MSLDNKAVNLADLKVSHDYLVGQDSLLSERIDTLGSGIDDVESFIGDLSDLSTTLKDNLVDAINEVLQTGGKVKSVNGKTGDVVLKTSDLTNDSGYLTSYTETDPTVPSWAKQQQKPSYTASEVGAATTEALTTEITTRTASDAQLQSQITALGNGAPIPVETVAEMIDNTKAYLYTGAEAGWLTGYWYTYDSTQAKFVPRGEYGVGTVIDDTLTVSGDAADAKATGDAISEVKAQIPGVDASLATAGKAADAKATGDALTTINGRLTQDEDNLFNSVLVNGGESASTLTSTDWEQGYLKPDTGGMQSATSAIRTPFIFFTNTFLKWEKLTEQNVGLRIFKYDSVTREFIRYDGWFYDTEKTVFLDGLYKFVATIGSGIEVVPSDIDTFYSFTEYKNTMPTQIDEIHDTVYEYGPDISKRFIFSAGSITPATQVVSSSTKRIVTRAYFDIDSKPITYAVADGYRVYIWLYDDSENPTTNNKGIGWVTGSGTVEETKKYLRIVFGKADDSTFGVSDYTEDLLSVRTCENSKIWENSRNIDVLSTRLEAVEDEVNPSIPAYWETALDSAKAKVKANQLLTDFNGDSFIFITDTHWPQNTKVSPNLIKRILADKEINISKVVFGGDVLNLHSTQAQAYGYLRDFSSAFDMSRAKFYPVAGNHDWNDNVAGTYPEAHLSNAQVYSCLFKKTESDVVINHSDDTDRTKQFYYYTDNETQKIRYIFLQNGKGGFGTGEQATWLQSKLTELSADWTVVIFAHMYWFGLNGNTPAPAAAGTAVTTAIDAVFSQINATIAALIVGHCHYDYDITTANGYKIIATSTDCCRLSDTAISPTMTAGTDTEQTFDIFSIDIANRKILTVRVGAGSDREFSY